MIKDIYRGSRFPADDLPLLQQTWDTLDEWEQGNQAQVLVEVLAGDRYRRRIPENDPRAIKGIGRVGYRLQAIVSPILQVNNWGTWNKSAAQLVADLWEVGDSMELAYGELMAPDVQPPKYEGPFGNARFEDSLTYVTQPTVVMGAMHERTLVEIRLGVAAQTDNLRVVVGPDVWDGHTVRKIKNGFAMIDTSNA